MIGTWPNAAETLPMPARASALALSRRQAEREARQDLQRIPGIGPSLAGDLWDLGIGSVSALRGQDPQELYEAHARRRGMQIDRCVLYAFRCAVYFADNEQRELDPELLKWWNWKD